MDCGRFVGVRVEARSAERGTERRGVDGDDGLEAARGILEEAHLLVGVIAQVVGAIEHARSVVMGNNRVHGLGGESHCGIDLSEG